MARAKKKQPAAKSGRKAAGIKKTRATNEEENRAIHTAAAVIRSRGGRGTSGEKVTDTATKAPKSPVLVESSLGNTSKDEVNEVPESVLGGVKALQKALIEAFPGSLNETSFSVNETKPRSKSFEFVLLRDGEEEVVWSGLKLGPPRAQKFPAPEKLVELFAAKLNKN